MTIPNADQRAAWNGESAQRWVVSADRRDTVLSPIADVLADRAAIGPGERVLDIGCGCGATTLAAAAATGPTGAVVGADLSAPMLDVARTRAAEQGNVEFRQADVQTDPLVSHHSRTQREAEASCARQTRRERGRPSDRLLKTLPEVEVFAKEVGVADGVVVGRMQHEGLIPHYRWTSAFVR